MIPKGDSVSEEKPIAFSFYNDVSLDSSFVFYVNLHFCVRENAPKFNGQGECTPNPFISCLTDNGIDVSKHCELIADLSKVPKEIFDLRSNSRGQKYYHVDYELVLTPTSAALLFELRINSMSYGAVRARYY